MALNYDNLALKSQKRSIKSDKEKTLDQAIKSGFPNCKGTYPDCPENPSKEDTICKNCPILEEILEDD